MADLRSNFESTLVTLRNQPFEIRWARYWSMVLEALEYAPETLEHLNHLIVSQEEQIAAAESRPTIERMLGGERDTMRREADQAVMEFLAPFQHSEGTTEERAALASERRRIRAEIHPHAQRADPPDAYETYVLVLDYATAFASASALVFRTASVPQPVAPAQPRVPPRSAQMSDNLRHRQPQQPRQAPPPPRPVHYEPDPHHQARPAQPPQHRQPEPRHRYPEERHYAEERRYHPEERRRPPEQRALEPVGEPELRPMHLGMDDDGRAPRPRKRSRLPLIIAAVLFFLLAGGVGALYVIKPDLLALPDLATLFGPSGTDTPGDDTPVATETPADTKEVAEGIPSTPLDRYYKVIVATEASLCTAPSDIAKSNWAEIKTFVDCTKTQSIDLVSSFRYMLAQAGGRWLGTGTWTAPDGPMKVQLESAWDHVSKLGSHWSAQASASVKEYGSSYFGFQSHGTTGWRFAAWRCHCNLKGEFVASDTQNVKPRLFITSPAEIQTEDEARQAYMQVRGFFLGPDAQGNSQNVELGVNNAQLPYDLPGGLGMARPLASKEEADKAWKEVTSLHEAIGFQVHELKWAAQ